MAKLREVLKKWPWAHAELAGGYRALLYLLEKHFLGSRIHAWRWRRRRALTQEELLRTVAHPHREFLVTHIARQRPSRSVLEIGCGAGPNLYLLARMLPSVSFHGVDLNPSFVRRGKEWLASRRAMNVSLTVGHADDLSQFDDQSIDVTFTDATLMYVGPDRIGQTLREMKRVTRKALVLNEWHRDDVAVSFWYDSHWVYNYESLLREHVPGGSTRITALPEGLWEDEVWRKYGALVEADLI